MPFECVSQFVGEPSTDVCGDASVLKKQRALEIFTAVQAGAQDEVTIQKRPGVAKKRQQIFAHRVFFL